MILRVSRLMFCTAPPLGFYVQAAGSPASLMPQGQGQDSPTLDSWTPGLLDSWTPPGTPLPRGMGHWAQASNVQLLRVLFHCLGALQGSSNRLVLGWAAVTFHVGGALPVSCLSMLNPFGGGNFVCSLGAPHRPASSSSGLRRLPLPPRAWWGGASRLARS